MSNAMDKDIDALVEERVQALLDQKLGPLVDERVAKALATHEAKAGDGQLDRIAIIASKGSLDMAYPPLILATTAAAMGMEAGIFFTFYGLDIVNKHKYNNLKVAPLANPAAPIPVPNIIGVLPGMTSAATMMMNSWMSKANVASIAKLMDQCKMAGVRLIACQMTMDVLGIKREDLIDGVEIGGAATFLDFAADSDINLYI